MTHRLGEDGKQRLSSLFQGQRAQRLCVRHYYRRRIAHKYRSLPIRYRPTCLYLHLPIAHRERRWLRRLSIGDQGSVVLIRLYIPLMDKESSVISGLSQLTKAAMWKRNEIDREFHETESTEWVLPEKATPVRISWPRVETLGPRATWTMMFSSKPLNPTQLQSRLKRYPALFGIPFLVIIVGASFGLQTFTQTRYDLQDQKVQQVWHFPVEPPHVLNIS